MPIYEYRCGACGRAFERYVQAGQAVACPACASSQVTRLLSMFGFKSGSSVAAGTGGGGCGCGRGGCGCH